MNNTPGPWLIAQPFPLTIRHAASDRKVAVVVEQKDRLMECANARLLAAAPELVKALENLLAKFQHEYSEMTDGEHGDIEDFPQVVAARAAVAKAKEGLL